MIDSTEAATTSSAAPSTLLPGARGVARPAELNCCIYSIIFWQLLYADYECFASSVSVPYVFGKCTMRLHFIDLIVLI